MKKMLTAGLLVLMSAAAVVSALAFLNNLAVIAAWWSAFAAAGGDSSRMAVEVSGFLPWLDWAAVDYSAVTTFIPTVGFLCLAIGAARLLAGRRARIGDFPFFRGSDQLFVALGLFGTLWGIIVIGYFRLDTVQMGDLMQCLHTALFSTLMAVVWVFMIDRPLLRPLYARLLVTLRLAEGDEGDLSAAVGRLAERLNAASDAFDRRQRAYEQAFEQRQKEYQEFFLRRIEELERKLAEEREASCRKENRLKAVADALRA